MISFLTTVGLVVLGIWGCLIALNIVLGILGLFLDNM